MSSMNILAHLRIPLGDIKVATNDFSTENFIGHGGFGKVYQGKLSRSEGQITVAVKRLDRNSCHGQGQREFLMEIMMLSRYQHKNLVTLLGFCDEKDEMILVYEHEFHGSLDKHLCSINLTWSQRLKICCGAARGLLYLHNPDGGLQRVLHRDIKSSNILLDWMGEAKISDFGISKLGPANQQFTFLVTHAVGTVGYCDPQYAKTGILTKESDVYSFGVVLFEVLCGRLCFENYDDSRRFLAELVKQRYKENKLDDIIYDSIKEQIDPDSLAKFLAVAYRCLSKHRDERPTMVEVVKELESALDFQEKRDATVVHMEGSSTGLLDHQSTFKQYRLRLIAQFHGEEPEIVQNIELGPDDELFATAAFSGCIKVFDFSKVVNESRVENHPVVGIQTSSTICYPVVDIQTSSPVSCLSWNKDIKNYIASSSNIKGTISVWDLNKKKSLMEYKEHKYGVSSVDFSSTEPLMLVSGADDRKVKVWSINQKTSVINMNLRSLVCSVKYHPGSSKHIAVGTQDGCCLYYDLRNTSNPLNTFTGHKNWGLNIKFLSDEELVCVSPDNALRLWDIKRNMLVRTYKGHKNEDSIEGLSVHNDFIACGSETDEVFVYHKAFSKPMTCHKIGSKLAGDNFEFATSDFIHDVCWKSDGSAIVTSSDNGVVQVLTFEAQRG